MNYQRTIGIITKSQSVFNTFVEQMRVYFGELARLKGFCLDEQQPAPLDCDLCVVSHYGIRDLAEELTGKRVFVARRTLNPTRLTKLFELPANSRVLVVNNFQEAAEETVTLLKELGVDHLDLTPYYPGSEKELQEIKAAVTPGMVSLVPRYVEQVIDVGNRIIDLSSLIEISVYGGFPMRQAHFMSARLTREITKLNVEQADLVKGLKQTNKQMEVILNNVGEGVIAVDDNNQIMACNSAAKSLLGITDVNVNGLNVNQFLADLDLDRIVASGIPETNKLYEINNNQLLVTKTPIVLEGVARGVVLILREIAELAKASHDFSQEMQKRGYVAKYVFANIISHSEEMKKAVKLAKQLSLADLPVLISGESGTGKELFAQSIHNYSHQRTGPFIAVNLAALPETLVDSELFGYEQGAFTGARKTGKPGLFELAHKGTIFLDEIGEISPGLQVKLLRVLEQKEVMRIGSTKVMPVDVRIITATNKNLKKMVREGNFRSDLYFRLCVYPLEILALRYRKQDIPALISFFYKKYCSTKVELPTHLLLEANNYDWPGNVRELEGMVRFSAQLGQGKAGSMFDLLAELIRNSSANSNPNELDFKLNNLLLKGTLEEFILILRELKKAKLERTRVGRNYLVQKVAQQGLNVSEQQIRTRLEYLKGIGCVQVGSGRQGTQITHSGERLLDTLCTMEKK